MKGIILAGGSGSRLYPLTKVVSKQLLPVHDKPMIYYPLSILMLAGIRDILIISTPDDLPRFERLLGNGSSLGIRLSYAEQMRPEGIAQAFLIGESFIGKDRVALILGDNLFHGRGLQGTLRECAALKSGGLIFGYQVKFPQHYGVVVFDENRKVTGIQEKPETPRSDFAVPGLYFYDNSVIQKARRLKPSSRKELEITEINQLYLEEGDLEVVLLGRGTVWLDVGTHNTLEDASIYIKAVQERQGLKIGCIEEIAWRMDFIGKAELMVHAKHVPDSEYGKYLLDLVSKEA